ncbi:MAG: hypothetical protein GC154_14500 [bacterium]|nr:hypothetical protein [bacterium]
MKVLSGTFSQAAAILAAALLLGLAVNQASDAPLPLIRQPALAEDLPWPVVTGAEVLEFVNQGAAIIIDARPAEDYALGHIPGAINLPFNEFDAYFEELGPSLPKDFPIVVYCGGGNCDDSHEVLYQLQARNFQDLSIYTEGWREWSQGDFPTEK